MGAASLVALTSAAGADTRTVSDPPNAQQFDPVSVTHGHVPRQSGVLFQHIVTRREWVAGALGEIRLSIWVNRPRRGRPDRTIVATINEVESLPFPPTAWMGVVRDKRDRFIGHANAWQPGIRSFRIEYAKRVLGPRVRSYRWAMVVRAGCETSRRYGLCGPPRRDRVPDRGTVLHRRP